MATIINERKASNNFVLDGELYRLPNPQEAVEIAFSTPDAETYYKPNKDAKTIFVLKGAGTVTFKKGDAMAGVKDYTATVTTEAFVTIESAKFIDKKTGLIKIEKTGSTQVAVLEVR